MDQSLDLRRAGPADAARRVLLLPGGMCTAEFFADVMGQAAPAEAGLGMVAATLPGFGRTTPPADLSMEHYARLMGELAATEGCQVVVGHSLGANVAIEMAALGVSPGPLVLLSPTFSRADEAKFLGVLDQVGRVPALGPLAWTAMLKALPPMMKKEMLKGDIPEDRAETLAADLGNNDPEFCRHVTRHYYEYLGRHPSLVARLHASGVRSWVVRGDRDDIGLKDEERRQLEANPQITMVTIADAGHAVLVEQPARVAEVIVEAAETVGG
ncbi:alpha/beta fold hydrolase [Streptomyces sp. YS-3]|uniref:alpha/beta fold hydrolase n=1 Tax=Streptomyces sp. YS-3 TaxID=3381352 RepID=UPI0038627DB8